MPTSSWRKKKAMPTVDWSAYADRYDVMTENNPAYQDLLSHCLKTVSLWPLETGEAIADLGAGTGNLSIPLARELPGVFVYHVERDKRMLSIATEKARNQHLRNWIPRQVDFSEYPWDIPPLAGVVTVHTIYAIPNPVDFIRRLCAQVRNGGHVYACDIGRPLDLKDWGRYLFRAILRKNGLFKTIGLLRSASLIRKHNKHVAQCQGNGTYWTHDLAEFARVFIQSGVMITESSDAFYRGYDDLVVGKKT